MSKLFGFTLVVTVCNILGDQWFYDPLLRPEELKESKKYKNIEESLCAVIGQRSSNYI